MRADAREVLVHKPVALLGDELEVERLSRGMVPARHDACPMLLEKRVDGIAEAPVCRLDLAYRRAGGAAELQLRGRFERDGAVASRKADEVAFCAVGSLGVEGAQMLEHLTDAQRRIVSLVADGPAVIEDDEVLDFDAEPGRAAGLLDAVGEVADKTLPVFGYAVLQAGYPISASLALLP